MYIAHTRNEKGVRHSLVEHLRAVAEMASQYAAAIGPEAATLARYLGLWHDVGKFNPAFQAYLLSAEDNPTVRGTGPDHKAAGAEIATYHLPILGLLVQAHHGGLHSPIEMQQWLKEKETTDTQGHIKAAMEAARQALPDLEPTTDLLGPEYAAHDPLATELFLRLLFSALVDADCLDTEAHFHRGKAALRGADTSMEELWQRLDASQASVRGQ